MDRVLLLTLILLCLLLLGHDLVPLGRWNNLRPDQQKPLLRRLASTLLNTAVGLVPTSLAWQALGVHGATAGRRMIAYFLAGLLLGAAISWWIPWLFGTSPQRQRELAAITDGTLAFVPTRHGVTPNALHCAIHVLVVLGFIENLLLMRAG